MDRWTKTAVLTALAMLTLSVSAFAIENDTIKVGLKYGSEAMSEANLQNYSPFDGYAFGYFDADRDFVSLASVSARCEKVTVTPDSLYHIQLSEFCDDADEAEALAANYGDAYIAYIDGSFCVRIGSYSDHASAESALASLGEEGSIVGSSSTGVTVVGTESREALFGFDCSGLRSLGILPLEDGEKTVTWFRGYRYYGGFEYQRVTGGKISVINVVDIEDYVRCVIPWEMSADWPIEALKAQSVCARTYAATQTRHRSQGFDVCATIDCQVYQGTGNCTELSDRAVDETAGEYIYYDGKIIDNAVYYSSNGGASEDCENVWGSNVPYLRGKSDPYEATVASYISKYRWSTTYTADELTAIATARGFGIGQVKNLYISALTDNGNVYSLTFVGTKGSKTVTRESCRTILNLRSMRFTIGGGDGTQYYVNGDGSTASLAGSYAISGGGTLSSLGSAGQTYVITASGTEKLEEKAAGTASDSFVISGSGNGHNVGMSQWGAYAMAGLGYDYLDILNFYYTGIEVY